MKRELSDTSFLNFLDYSGKNVIFAKKNSGHGQGTQKNTG